MAYFEVTVLGCGSATPTLRHNTSSQIVRYHNRLFMVDCGEGTQLQMRRYGISYAKISDIFISHLHGDHFLGLPGLLSTISLHNIGGSVTVHVFKEGAEILKQLMKVFCHGPSIDIKYNIIEPMGKSVIYEDKTLIVESFPLYHRVPCCGFIFREKPKPRHLRGDMAKFYNIPVWQLRGIKEDGNDFVTADGTIIPNERLTIAAEKQMSYAYCSDTAYNPKVAEDIAGVDVIYHESTYGDDQAHKAASRFHSTAREAGKIASLAGASKLIIGHYSKTCVDSTILQHQAEEEFPVVIPADEGMKIDII